MDNNSFNYTYSAKEQSEIKKIRDKYLPQEPDKMQTLLRLDKSVTDKASTISIIIGIIGTLIMGSGMSLCMVVGDVWFILGIILGVVGIVILGSAYPIFKRILKKEREKVTPEILRLTEELLK